MGFSGVVVGWRDSGAFWVRGVDAGGGRRLGMELGER
jgi:hypothetical protein